MDYRKKVRESDHGKKLCHPFELYGRELEW